MNRLLIIACSFIFLSSCHFLHGGERVKGNGNIKKEQRTAGVFNSVEVSGDIDLYVKQDSARSINIETDENLLPYIEVRNDGDHLIISPKEGYNPDPSQAIKVYVSSPVFKELEASGASKIVGENMITSGDAVTIQLSGASDAGLELKSPKVSVDLSGASTMTLKGETKDLVAGASGASHIRGFDMLSENADVDVSGASNAEVFASVKLNAKASGASDVRYKGNAAVTQDESGASSVKKAE
jgi:hypothetical protein